MRTRLLEAADRHRAGDLAGAEKLYVSVLRDDPRNSDALAMLGTLNTQRGNTDTGVRLIDESLALTPNQPVAWFNRGNALQAVDRISEAIESFVKAANYDPSFTAAHIALGKIFARSERHREALLCFDRAVACDPKDKEVFFRRAVSLAGTRQFEKALVDLEQAMMLDPESLDIRNSYGNVLASLGRTEEALRAYDDVLARDPDYAETYSNRASSLFSMNRIDEAIESLHKAIALKPDYADAHWNLGLILLTLGQFKEGWSEYEWRWQQKKNLPLRRKSDRPVWKGEPIEGKTILLYPEQGLGDSIHFSRYAGLAAAQGANVLLEAPTGLFRLFESLEGPAALVKSGDPIPAYDYLASLMSLPHIFGTTLETIPATIPYLFATPDQKRRWAEKLGGKHSIRIGIAWSGSANHFRDRMRSVPANLLISKLTDVAGCSLHVLQKEYREPDQAFLQANPALVMRHETDLTDFADTAGLIANLDLVITVDTSIAHLAGAMGKPVWILLSSAPDYRWLLKRDDSPWYPTARLFRQSTPGNWSEPIERIAAALRAFIDSSGYQPGR